MKQQFLPICRQDMIDRGWEQVDFVYVSGDAYVDHPSFGTCNYYERTGGTWLQSRDHLLQPDWKDPESIMIFGEPRLGFLVSCGQYGFDGQSLFCIKKTKKNRCLYTGRRNGKTTGLCDNRIQ